MRERTNFGWTNRSRRAALAALFAALLLAAPAQAQGRFDNFGPKTFDAVLLRPLTFIQLVAGAGLLIPTAILTYFPAALLSRDVAKGNVVEAYDVFVVEPYERAVVRPLGAF